jgi:hypothetical protein
MPVGITRISSEDGKVVTRDEDSLRSSLFKIPLGTRIDSIGMIFDSINSSVSFVQQCREKSDFHLHSPPCLSPLSSRSVVAYYAKV